MVNNISENGKVLSQNSGNKFAYITQIINDWDPIGFFPMAPKDEYINEIQKISEFVCSNHNLQVQPLAQAINEIFVETFGTDVYDEDLEQCALIAKRILTLRGNKVSASPHNKVITFFLTILNCPCYSGTHQRGIREMKNSCNT